MSYFRSVNRLYDSKIRFKQELAEFSGHKWCQNSIQLGSLYFLQLPLYLRDGESALTFAPLSVEYLPVRVRKRQETGYSFLQAGNISPQLPLSKGDCPQDSTFQ